LTFDNNLLEVFDFMIHAVDDDCNQSETSQIAFVALSYSRFLNQ